MTSLSELRSYTVVVAGTFGPLHDGHRELLEEALQQGDAIVGITSDELARSSRDNSRYVPSYNARRTRVRDELVYLSRKYENDYAIIKIDDPYALATELENIETLVVTPKDGAFERAKEINERRVDAGLSELDIATADVVEADDGGPISSTRIVNMEINEHGNLLE